MSIETAEAIEEANLMLVQTLKALLTSPNVSDSNMEKANLVDTTDDIARALHRVADALFAIKDAM